MLCYVMLCYVMLCYVMLCYVMLCYAMLCYAMLYFSGLERPICNQRGPRFAGKIFKTSDKYLTLRLSGLEEYVSNISASLVVVTYNDGELFWF